jgi:hypothetical protein
MRSRAGDPGLLPLKGESQRRGGVARSAQPDGSPARAQQILQAAGVACAQVGSHHSRWLPFEMMTNFFSILSPHREPFLTLHFLG